MFYRLLLLFLSKKELKNVITLEESGTPSQSVWLYFQFLFENPKNSKLVSASYNRGKDGINWFGNVWVAPYLIKGHWILWINLPQKPPKELHTALNETSSISTLWRLHQHGYFGTALTLPCRIDAASTDRRSFPIGVGTPLPKWH